MNFILSIAFLALLSTTSARVLDMTYTFEKNTNYWPGNKNFEVDTGLNGTYETPNGNKIWVQVETYSAASHGGTHMDAPTHILTSAPQHEWTIDQIPPHRLMGPLRIMDISRQASTNREYKLTVSDIHQHELQHGRIPKGAIVLIYSGWGAKWGNKSDFFGKNYEKAQLDFPGFSLESAQWLTSMRDLHGVGIDTASIDIGSSPDWPVHRVFFDKNIYALENVANVGEAPEAGAVLLALPLKTGGGSGGPTRVLAVWDDDMISISAARIPGYSLSLMAMIMSIWSLSNYVN